MVGYSQRIKIMAMAGLLLLAVAPAMAQAEIDQTYGDDYRSADYGRVQFHENGLTIRRAAADPSAVPEEAATLNTPVFPGDSVFTEPGQRAEIQLTGGSLVRIDDQSEATFLAMPGRTEAVPDHTVLQLLEGRIRVSVNLAEDEEFRIDTPAASVYVLGEGDFRIEVDGDMTRVISHRGVAEVVGDDGSVIVRGGMRTEVLPSDRPAEPWPFNTFVSDSFDRWVEDRDGTYRAGEHYAESYEQSAEVYEELPEPVQPYYRELSGYGDWTHTSEYGYVWRPARMAAEWRPYWDGYWAYGPGGYFWVSYEPWGWAPYRYGRWSFVSGSWCWIPGRVFAGAWVAWSWGSAYVGWAPLGFWNRPCYVGPVHHRYYDRHSWTFVHHTNIHVRDYRRHGVDVRHVGDHVRDGTVLTRAPRVSPKDLARNPNLRRDAHLRARADRSAHLDPIDRGSRPRDNMRDIEARMRRAPQADGRTRGEPSRPRSMPTNGRVTRTGPTRRPAALRSSPRPDRPGRERSTAGRGSTPTPQTPRVRPRRSQTSGRSADQGRRELYEQMARPRRTSRQPASTARPPAGRERNRNSANPPKRSPTPRPTSTSPSRSSGNRRGNAGPSRRPSTPRPTTTSPSRSNPNGRGSAGPSRRPSTPRPTTTSPSSRPSAPRSTSGSRQPSRQPKARPNGSSTTGSKKKNSDKRGGRSGK